MGPRFRSGNSVASSGQSEIGKTLGPSQNVWWPWEAFEMIIIFATWENLNLQRTQRSKKGQGRRGDWLLRASFREHLDSASGRSHSLNAWGRVPNIQFSEALWCILTLIFNLTEDGESIRLVCWLVEFEYHQHRNNLEKQRGWRSPLQGWRLYVKPSHSVSWLHEETPEAQMLAVCKINIFDSLSDGSFSFKATCQGSQAGSLREKNRRTSI